MKLISLCIFFLLNISTLHATRPSLVFTDQSNNLLSERKNKHKLIWTPDLKSAFEDALKQINGHATPAMILNHMKAKGDFPSLTRVQVASYLQRHRQRVIAAAVTQVAQQGSDEELPNINNNSNDAKVVINNFNITINYPISEQNNKESDEIEEDDETITNSEIENASPEREPDFHRKPFDHLLNSYLGAGFIDVMNPEPEVD